jgi:hypothetical protein
MSFSILMLRSPLSGAVRTFINDTAVIADNSVSSLLNLSYLGTTAKLCVDPNGLSSNKPTEILINAGATNPAAIETVGDADVVRYACR